jgi:hypothetical protein
LQRLCVPQQAQSIARGTELDLETRPGLEQRNVRVVESEKLFSKMARGQPCFGNFQPAEHVDPLPARVDIMAALVCSHDRFSD